MAIDPNAAIAGVAQLGSTIASNVSARKMQKRQMRWNEKFWHMQNLYNSPQEQMKRLQEAGLNPNLVYGGSPGGTAGTAERMSAPEVDPAAHRYLEGVMPTISQYADVEVKQAQSDNLKAQTQVAQENQILLAQKAYGEGIRNARTRFDLNLAEELRGESMERAKEEVRKMKMETAGHDIRNQLTASQMRNVRADYEVKALDSKLAKMGIRPQDPKYISLITRAWQKAALKLGYLKEDYYNYINNPVKWRQQKENR